MTREHGKVARWVCDRGFGFIDGDSGQSVFCHVSDLPEGMDELEPGTRVTYVLAPGRDGKMRAADVRLA